MTGDNDKANKNKITLHELAKIHEISLRSFNVCHQNGLNNLEKILAYYRKESSFLKLKNCGRKTNLELIHICRQYVEEKKVIDNSNDLPDIRTNIIRNNKFQNLTKDEEIYLYRYFGSQLKKLSKRSRNAINSLLKEKGNSFSNLYAYLEEINFNFSGINHVGKKSSEEIELFFNNFFSVSDLIRNTSKNDLSFYAFLSLLEMKSKKNYKRIEKWIRKHRQDFEENSFPFLPFISEIIKQLILLDERKTFIFNNFHNRKKNSEKLTLEKIGDEFGVTRERIRQLSTRKKLLDPFLKDIKEIFLELGISRINFSNIKVDFNDTLIIIDIDFVHSESSTHFSSSFVYQVLDTLTNEHELLINDESESKYLVKKEILELLDLRGLFEQLKSILSSKIEKDFSINLKGLIFEFLIEKKHSERIDEFIFVCERIIFEEFGLFADINGNLKIEKTIKKPVYEYIIDVLKSKKEPMHVDEIFAVIEKSHPGITKSPDAIRSHIIKYNNIFINTAWSTYGLKEWEKTGLFVGGSIKDLVEMYLDKFDEPKHIYEISIFVTSHRNTSLPSIYSNLQKDPHDRFILYSGGFVGLQNKNYDPETTRFKGIPPHTFRGFKKKFFRKGKSIYTYDEIVSFLANKFSIREVQIKASLEQKIANNFFKLKNGHLIIIDHEH